MNVRKAATSVPSTLSRLLKSNSFLRKPPPAYYPLLAHPPAPSLVRFLPHRPAADLPPSFASDRTPHQRLQQKRDDGHRLTPEEEAIHAAPSDAGARRTRRRPKTAPTKSRPLPIVFPEDRIRRQFFRDHPFEAYRPVVLVENELIAEAVGPSGKEWISLRQRTPIPTAEECVTRCSGRSTLLTRRSCIAFVISLHEAHEIPLNDAYTIAVTQFRTLRAEHETATRSAMLEATCHGAVFFGEVQKGILVEERVLDEWVHAREVESRIQSKLAETGRSSTPSTPISTSAGSPTFWQEMGEKEVQPEAAAPTQEMFTGGEEYVRRFADRHQTSDETEL